MRYNIYQPVTHVNRVEMVGFAFGKLNVPSSLGGKIVYCLEPVIEDGDAISARVCDDD